MWGPLYDWLVVTADGLLVELVVPSEEAVVSSDDVVVGSEAAVVLDDEPVVAPELEDADAVVCVPVDDVAVPMEPSYAIAPNASAKMARDTVVTRLRIRAMRAPRARSFSAASSLGDGLCSFGEGIGSVMTATVGGRCESGPGRPRELPGTARRRALDQTPGRSRAAPGLGADHSSWPRLRALSPTQKESS
jgi:hypothetical protein